MILNCLSTLSFIGFRLQPNRNLGRSRCRKCVRSALQPLEKTLYWIHSIRVWAGPEADSWLKVLCGPFKHRFSNSTNSHFGMVKRPKRSSTWRGQEVEKDFKVPFDNLKHRFFDFKEIAFWAGRKAENDLAVPCNHKKSGFNDFTQVAFWSCPGAENWLYVPCGPLKYRFLDLNKDAFWNGKIP